jgi:hypothetical protein
VHDDLVVVDSSMADQITAWRHSQKLADAYLGDHWCSGKTCSYYQIDDVFLCEKTGRVHSESSTFLSSPQIYAHTVDPMFVYFLVFFHVASQMQS